MGSFTWGTLPEVMVASTPNARRAARREGAMRPRGGAAWGAGPRPRQGPPHPPGQLGPGSGRPLPGEEAADLRQGEVQLLEVPDHLELAQLAVVVETETAPGADGVVDQAQLLIIADGAEGDPGPLRQLPDLHWAVSGPP